MNENPMNNSTMENAALENSGSVENTSGNPASTGTSSASADDGGAAGSGGDNLHAEDFAAPDWRDQLPEAWRAELGDIGSMDAALAAFKRGLAYNPVADTKALDAVFEGVEVDEAMNADFRKLAVEHGLTESQVKALLKFEGEAFAAMEQRYVEEATNTLKQAWGGDFERKSNEAVAAMLRFDKSMGGRLSEWLGGADGVKNSPVVMELLAVAGKAISEDSIGGGNSAASPDKPETAEDMFREIFRKG